MILALREGDELVIRAASGEVDHSQTQLAIPLEDALSGHVQRSGRAQRLSGSTAGISALLLNAFGAHTELVVPLRFRGQGLGVLAALDRLSDGPNFSAEDERLMSTFATSAAAAVATARDVAADSLRRSLQAAERERSRWARELHDQTLQDLAGLKVMLSGARRAKEREHVDRILEQAIEHAQLAVDALRGLVTELRPAALDDLGTAPALRALIDRTATTAGLEIDLRVDLAYEQGRADTRHAPELERTMYRLVQEALTNVVKHAGASRVTVAAIEDDATVELTVTDDGAGFQTDAASEGFGLIGMRERITLLGGELDFDSQPGAGTTVAARIPVQRRLLEPSAGTPDLEPARRSA
jgi:signal transduction histidine kinase